MYRIYLFGRPRACLGDKELPLSEFETALLCLIYGSGDIGISRSTAVMLLWGADDAATRHRLSQLFYAANRKTGSSLFRARSNVLGRGSIDYWCDLDQFLRDCDEARIWDAHTSFEQGLCEGAGRVNQNLQDWLDDLALALRDRLSRAADRCLLETERTGQWYLAVDAARILSALEPWNEQVLRKLMLAYAMAGQPERAEAAYESYRELVDSESYAPDNDTVALLTRIQRKNITSPNAREATRLVEDPPLCGRNDEFRKLREYLLNDRDELTLVVLRGEGGIGKSRLIRECVAEAGLRGALVLGSKAAELEREIPFNALLEALRSEEVEHGVRKLAEPWRSVLLSLMPEMDREGGVAQSVPLIQPEALQRRLFEAVRQLFLTLAAGRRVVVFLDDFHWADDTSVAALEYMRRRWDGCSLTIVIAFRPEEISGGSNVGKFVRGIRDWGNTLVLDIGELSDGASTRLVRALGQDRVSDRDVAQLKTLAGGNPFFLIELTLAYLVGHIELSVRESDEMVVPFSIRTLIDRRVEMLSRGSFRVLCLLAVYGRPATLREIARVTGAPRRMLIEALEVLQRERLVRWSGRRAILRHELIRQAVYRSLSAERRRWLHKRVAQHLLRHRVPTPSGDIALHYYRAGDHRRAFAFARDAAEKAEQAGAVLEAVRFLEIAHRTAGNDEQVTSTVGRLARLRYLQLNFVEAGPLLQLAAEHYNTQGCTRDRLLAESWRIDVLSRSQSMPLGEILAQLRRIKNEARAAREWDVVAEVLDVEWHLLDRVGEDAQLARVIEECEDCVRGGDSRAKAIGHRVLGVVHQYYGDPKQAIPHCVTAVEISRSQHLEEDLCRNLNALMVVYLNHGLLGAGEGIKVVEAAEALAARSGDLLFRYNVRLNVGVWLLDIGQPVDAEPYFQECERLIADVEAAGARATLSVNLGELYYELRDFERSCHYYRVLLESPSASRQWFLVAMAHAGLGLCGLFQGDLKECRKQEELLAQVDRGRPFFANDPSMILKFRAQLAHRRGNTRQAVHMLQETAELIRHRQVPNWIKLKVEAARLVAKEDAEEAMKLAREPYEVACALNLERRSGELRLFLDPGETRVLRRSPAAT